MSEHDPKRLLEGGAAPSALRALLEAGRTEVPSHAQMLGLAAKIGIVGGLGGAGAAGLGGAGGAGAGGAGAAKAAVGAATAVKAGIAIKVIGAVALAAVAGAGAVVVSNRSVEQAAPVGVVATPAPTAARVASTTATAEVVTPLASASARPARSVAAPSSATVAAVEVPDEGPQAEVKLLERAQDALRSRPAEALALCNDHVKRFPSGMLVQEREVIAIEALVKTGRKDEARARADRFKARFPGSSHTRRLEALLAN